MASHTSHRASAWRPRARARNEDGSVIPVVAVTLVLMLLLLALVIDLGTMRTAQEHAQSAADAGALAGAQDLAAGTTAAAANSDAVALSNKNYPGAAATSVSPYNGNTTSVQVGVTSSVSLPFGGLFGISAKNVSASAVATGLLVNGFTDSNFAYPTQNNSSGSFFEEFCAANGTLNGLNPYCATANPVMGPWTVISGSVDLNGYQYLTVPPGDPNTTQVVDMVGSYSNGEITQSINTTPGLVYSVSFELSANTHGPPEIKPLQLLINNNTVQTYQYNGAYGTDATPAPMTWYKETASFTATSTSTSIAFLSTVNAVLSGANEAQTSSVNGVDFRYGAAITDLNITTTNVALTQ